LTNNKPRLISLFTGAGGLDLGLENAGFETLVANEIEPSACETLRANQTLSNLPEGGFKAWFSQQAAQRCYKGADPAAMRKLAARLKPAVGSHRYLSEAKIVEKDVREVTSEDLMGLAGVARGELDLIAGGPPCQPFSRAGKRETVETDTGKLFREFVRIVDDLRPRWFLFENVKGLVLSKTELLETACKSCGHTGLVPFELRGEPLKDGKVPCRNCAGFKTTIVRRMKRGGSLDIILNEFEAIGYKCYAQVLNAADFGAPQTRERLIIVGSRDQEPFDWPEETHIKGGEKSAQPELFGSVGSRKPWRSMYEALWEKGHFEFGKLDKSKAVLWVKNVVRPHAEPVTWSLDRPSPTIGAHQAAKLAMAPDGIPPEQLARQQWHSLGRRMRDSPPVDVKHAYLSDEELITLQTFPPCWYFYGTRMQRAAQIGNAVPPILAEAVGRAIIAASKISKKTPTKNAPRKNPPSIR
jgi:DNA (cytosine-5)-methyltransferase 1